jgi:hypothetical protein
MQATELLDATFTAYLCPAGWRGSSSHKPTPASQLRPVLERQPCRLEARLRVGIAERRAGNSDGAIRRRESIIRTGGLARNPKFLARNHKTYRPNLR